MTEGTLGFAQQTARGACEADNACTGTRKKTPSAPSAALAGASLVRAHRGAEAGMRVPAMVLPTGVDVAHGGMAVGGLRPLQLFRVQQALCACCLCGRRGTPYLVTCP